MATHPNVSMIEAYRRPSGGLGGEYNGVELDWEPGEPPVPFDARLLPIWRAIERHMQRPRQRKN